MRDRLTREEREICIAVAAIWLAVLVAATVLCRAPHRSSFFLPYDQRFSPHLRPVPEAYAANGAQQSVRRPSGTEPRCTSAVDGRPR